MKTKIISLDRGFSGGVQYSIDRARAHDSDRDAEHDRMVWAIRNIINSDLLTERQRTVVYMYYSDLQTVGDIAGVLGVTPSVISTMLDRAENTVYKVMSCCFPRLHDAPRARRLASRDHELTIYGMTTGGAQ